jgi:SAM-dependent methyltransferase
VCWAGSETRRTHESDRNSLTGQIDLFGRGIFRQPGFPDRTFDVVAAVETHYYWPDLPANVREVLRVLKAGGPFALIAETYRGGPLRFLYGMIMPLLGAAFLSDTEHRDLLTQAGFTEVATKHVSGKNWILAAGRRPTATPVVANMKQLDL